MLENNTKNVCKRVTVTIINRQSGNY